MHRAFHKWTLLAIDVVLVALATVFALVLRDNFAISAARLETFLPYLVSSAIAAGIVLTIVGANRTIWRFSTMGDYLNLGAASFFVVMMAVAATFLSERLESVPRSVPVIQWLLITTMLVGVRAAMRLRHDRRQRRAASALAFVERPLESILVVGITPAADAFLRVATEFGPARLRVAGVLGSRQGQSGRLLHRHPVLGVPEEVGQVLRRLEVHGISVDRIMVTVPFANLSFVAQQALRDIEATSDIKLDFVNEQMGYRAPANVTAIPTAAGKECAAFSLDEVEKLATRPYFGIKRIFDLMVATTLLVLCLPVAVIATVLVAFDVGWPVLFWQQRPGMGGRPFRLYKFRTMRAAHNESGTRISDDKRVSAIGRFLRGTRLDELPQLFNIILGDMSFIGPRPLLPVDQTPRFAARLLVRPGLTGWAQVAGGRGLSVQDKAALDIWYVCHASLRTDLSILFRTIPMVVLGERRDEGAIDEAWKYLRYFDFGNRARPGWACR